MHVCVCVCKFHVFKSMFVVTRTIFICSNGCVRVCVCVYCVRMCCWTRIVLVKNFYFSNFSSFFICWLVEKGQRGCKNFGLPTHTHRHTYVVYILIPMVMYAWTHVCVCVYAYVSMRKYMAFCVYMYVCTYVYGKLCTCFIKCCVCIGPGGAGLSFAL